MHMLGRHLPLPCYDLALASIAVALQMLMFSPSAERCQLALVKGYRVSCADGGRVL